MKTITVGLEQNSYNIHIGSGCLEKTGELVKSLLVGADDELIVVTDANVAEYWAGVLDISLERSGIKSHILVLEPGEANKSLEGLACLYDFFSENNLRRNGLVLALGGGVIGDLCGFAAATWMRGVRYVQIPTSLLAQVDSSVGGKTAVNIPQGKNLVGAFYQPSMVIIDPETLSTLPEREMRCGMAEVIKYGAIKSKSFFDMLDSDIPLDFVDIIGQCCAIKAEVVERDERESGERMLLNFGHTFGHAIENRYRYQRYNHGEAVAMGMYIAACLGEHMSLSSPGLHNDLARVLKRHGLIYESPCPLTELLGAIAIDKKSEKQGVKMVFVSSIGQSFYKSIAYDDLAKEAAQLEEKWNQK